MTIQVLKYRVCAFFHTCQQAVFYTFHILLVFVQICEMSFECSAFIQRSWKIVSDRFQWRIIRKSMLTSHEALQLERKKDGKNSGGLCWLRIDLFPDSSVVGFH